MTGRVLRAQWILRLNGRQGDYRVGVFRAAPYSPRRPYGRVLWCRGHGATDRAYVAPPGLLSRTRLGGTGSRAGVTIKSPCTHFQVLHGTGTARHRPEHAGHSPSAVGSCSASNPTQYRTYRGNSTRATLAITASSGSSSACAHRLNRS